jgi:hypothetical protein
MRIADDFFSWDVDAQSIKQRNCRAATGFLFSAAFASEN